MPALTQRVPERSEGGELASEPTKGVLDATHKTLPDWCTNVDISQRVEGIGR